MTRKRNRPMHDVPARGGVTASKPGTNLATRKRDSPYLAKIFFDLRSWTSGSRVNLCMKCNTLSPLRRPASYQTQSANTQAVIARLIVAGTLNLPFARGPRPPVETEAPVRGSRFDARRAQRKKWSIRALERIEGWHSLAALRVNKLGLRDNLLDLRVELGSRIGQLRLGVFQSGFGCCLRNY